MAAPIICAGVTTYNGIKVTEARPGEWLVGDGPAGVVVGLPPEEFPVPLFDVVARCVTIRGSFVGAPQDMAEALWLAAAGLVAADIELQPVSAINKVFARLKHDDVPSRKPARGVRPT